MSACPCNPAVAYSDCCGPLHAGTARATTAEALMRSRYSAFVLGDAAYLQATWHPGTRPATLQLDDGGATRWLGLAVKRHAPAGRDPAGRETATVEFVARHRTGGAPAVRLHEVSRFVREDGCWYYLDGVFPPA
jgi:SEC-C motif-containing protein